MNKLKIAIQKSGRLHDDSLQLLKDCGISIDNGKDQLKASARNFPLEVFYLRNGDIPQYLRDGVVDAAIIGENVLVEKGETQYYIFLIRKGHILQWMQRFEEALQNFQEVFDHHQGNYIHFAFQHRGKCYLDMEDYEKAQSVWVSTCAEGGCMKLSGGFY